MAKSVLERFEEKVMVDPNSGCWLWTRGLNPGGYGSFFYEKRPSIQAHRAAYLLYVGPIPSGMELDHLCRMRSCVNPNHLEPVTRQENLRRGIGPTLKKAEFDAKTHCPKGHKYTQENCRIQKIAGGFRRYVCRECLRNYKRARRLKHKAAHLC